MAKKDRYVQVIDGKVDRWWKQKDGKAVYFTVCCDCGLTHCEEIRDRGRYFGVRVWRDDARTKKYRGNRRIIRRSKSRKK